MTQPPPAPPLPFTLMRPPGGTAPPPPPPLHPVHARVPSKIPESILHSSPSLPKFHVAHKRVVSELPQSIVNSIASQSPTSNLNQPKAPSKLPRSLSALELTPSAPPISASTASSPEPSDGPVPRLPIMTSPHPTSHMFRSSSSSPRRPRRAGTGLPFTFHQTNVSDFEVGETAPGDRPARDEFEEEFLAQGVAEHDAEGRLINSHLERVEFRQLEDDEEVLSEIGSTGRPDQQAEKHSPLQTVDLRKVKQRQSTIRSNWRRIPSEVGCEGCKGCERLCGENRRLRRQLDELEFELASGVLHNPADGFGPRDIITTVPIIPQIPIPVKRRKHGWAARFKNPTSASLNGTRTSEKERLKSEVKALAVTTEYLWRKLNLSEMELRTYRMKDLRNRMKMNGSQSEKAVSMLPRMERLDIAGPETQWE